MSISDDLDSLANMPSSQDISDDLSKDLDLLAAQPAKPHKKVAFSDLSKEDQAKAMDLARQQISSQYPNMPNWLRDMMLSITPKDESPHLQKAANAAQQLSSDINVFPAVVSGAAEGLSTIPRGVASFIPGKFADNFANQPALTSYTPAPQNDVEQGAQDTAKFVGSLGGLGKLFGTLKAGSSALKIPKALQNATALMGTGAIATPGGAWDKTLGAAEGLALGGAGKVIQKTAEKVPPFLRGLFNSSTENDLVKSVQNPHDVLQNTAETLYDQVRGAIKRRNVSVNVNPSTLDEILDQEAMKTPTVKKLVDAAKQGDYDSLHKLQSSLYQKGTKDMLNPDAVVETRGENLMDLRQRINKEIENNLLQQGHVDIAHVLRQGKNIYKQLMDTYFAKDLPKGIGKLVQSDLRKVPENAQNLFSENSKPMAKFLKQHPETAKHVQGINEKQAAIKALHKILWGAGGVGVGLTGGRTLYDLLK